jgi:hypothetical protein
VPSHYHVTIYIFVFCQCSLFFHRTILLVPISASTFLTSCPSLVPPNVISFTRQYMAPTFCFLTHGKNSMFIVHRNPLSPSTPIVHHIMPLLASSVHISVHPLSSSCFLNRYTMLASRSLSIVATIFCLLTPTKLSLILIISYRYSFHSHKISHNPIRSNVSLSHSWY